MAASSEYSLTRAVKSSPAFAFAATSSARFFASSFVRLTVAGAFFAPLKAMSTCCAATDSGLSVPTGLSGAGAAALGVGAACGLGGAGLAADAVVDPAVAVAAGGSSQPSAKRNVLMRMSCDRSMNGVVARERGEVKLL